VANSHNQGSIDRRAARIAMTSIVWQPGDTLDLEEWIRLGMRLGSIGRGAAWWIGDWVNYGNAKFGEKYSRAARVTGYDVQSLMNMAYVSSRFQVSRRREMLSWSHHAEVAALSTQEQERWLDLAERERLSVHGLRDRLRVARTQAQSALDNPQPQPDRDEADHALVCPRCGYDMAPAH
jgi:hypothetical protein